MSERPLEIQCRATMSMNRAIAAQDPACEGGVKPRGYVLHLALVVLIDLDEFVRVEHEVGAAVEVAVAAGTSGVLLKPFIDALRMEEVET